MDSLISVEESHIDLVHEIGNHLASSIELQDVLMRVVQFTIPLVNCDSCLIYVLEDDHLVL
jgi:hypothetical protein